MATEYGDDVLGKVCGAIASDESRHEIAYTRIVDEFFRWGWRLQAGQGCDVGMVHGYGEELGACPALSWR
jgi:hypothetical protein